MYKRLLECVGLLHVKLCIHEPVKPKKLTDWQLIKLGTVEQLSKLNLRPYRAYLS
jgi:hypothetical protein